MRSLDPEEVELWGRVTATIRPLSREPLKPSPVEKLEASAPRAMRRNPPVGTERTRSKPTSPGNTLDGSWDKKLSSGAIVPDRILDLHGMNLDSAWRAIDRALEKAIAAGDRVVLLITGHHRRGDPPVERGRIRAAVHDWLAASRHTSSIAAVRDAHRRHGGGGSLYIVLRRR